VILPAAASFAAPGGSGDIGAACAIPEAPATKPAANTIAIAVRVMPFSFLRIPDKHNSRA
jgi:hypothetical protein